MAALTGSRRARFSFQCGPICGYVSNALFGHLVACEAQGSRQIFDAGPKSVKEPDKQCEGGAEARSGGHQTDHIKRLKRLERGLPDKLINENHPMDAVKIAPGRRFHRR
jgi:hypothetical protein